MLQNVYGIKKIQSEFVDEHIGTKTDLAEGFSFTENDFNMTFSEKSDFLNTGFWIENLR